MLIQQQLNKRFDLVLACNTELCDIRSPVSIPLCHTADAFLAKDLSHKHVLIHAPSNQLETVISHYLSCKAMAPHGTSACLIVPAQSSTHVQPWRWRLRGMTMLHNLELSAALEVWHDARTPRPSAEPIDNKPAKLRSVGAGVMPVMTFHGSVNGIPAHMLLDSGATHVFCDKVYAEKHGLTQRATTKKVQLADGSTQDAAAITRLAVRIQGFCVVVNCYVLDLAQQYDVILGETWMLTARADMKYSTGTCEVRKHGRRFVLYPASKRVQAHARPKPTASKRIPAMLSAAQVLRHVRVGSRLFVVRVTEADTPTAQAATEADKPLELPPGLSPGMQALLRKYSHVFRARVGCPQQRQVSHTIPTEPGAKPPFRPMYRLSPLELAEVERQVKELLLNNLIEPSTSPYGAPILFVGKKDGTLRMCIDYRALNKITIKNKYPLPLIDQLMDQLSGAKVYTSLDLASGVWLTTPCVSLTLKVMPMLPLVPAGYHQIRITPEDVPKTAFRTPFGHYQFKVLSFGLSNAPATFQAAMNDIFRGQLGKSVVVYIDDILAYSKTPEEHLVHLEEVLQTLAKNDLFVKLSKCDFEKSEVKFLGHIVGKHGIRVDPAKTAVLSEWPVPKDVPEVRSFVGLATYFRKFIQGFSKLVAPLTNLTKQAVPWNWTDECQTAFENVKHALTHAPVLVAPDFTKPFHVIADASITGLGAVLMQEGNPIAFESRRLIPAEVNYTTSEQELLAVVHAFKTWRCFLEGVNDVTVITDHNPNVTLQTNTNLSRRQARWAEYLQRFRFTWEYRPGRTNVADPLSRHPSYRTEPTVGVARMMRLMMV